MNESSSANLLDFHFYQDSLYLIGFLVAAFAGAVVAKLIWRADEERCREIEWENRRLEADATRLEEV